MQTNEDKGRGRKTGLCFVDIFYFRNNSMNGKQAINVLSVFYTKHDVITFIQNIS